MEFHGLYFSYTRRPARTTVVKVLTVKVIQNENSSKKNLESCLFVVVNYVILLNVISKVQKQVKFKK